MGTYEQPGIIQPLAAQALAAAGTQIAKAGEVAVANITKSAIANWTQNKKIDEDNKKKQNAWGKEIGGVKTTKQGSFNENVGGFLENVGDWLFEVPNDPDLSAREIGIQEGRYSKIPDQVSNCNQAIAPQLKEYIEMMKRDPNSIGGMDNLRTNPNWRAIMQDFDQNKGANVNYTYEGERLYLTYTDPEGGKHSFDAEEFTRGSLKTKSMLQKVQDVSENKVIRGIVDQRVGKGQGGGGWAKIRYKELGGKNGIITDIAAWEELDRDITKQIMNGDYSNVINDPQSMEGYWTRLQLDNGVEEKKLNKWMGAVDKDSELFKEQRKNAEKWIPEYIDNNRDKFGMEPKLKEDPIEEVEDAEETITTESYTNNNGEEITFEKDSEEFLRGIETTYGGYEDGTTKALPSYGGNDKRINQHLNSTKSLGKYFDKTDKKGLKTDIGEDIYNALSDPEKAILRMEHLNIGWNPKVLILQTAGLISEKDRGAYHRGEKDVNELYEKINKHNPGELAKLLKGKESEMLDNLEAIYKGTDNSQSGNSEEENKKRNKGFQEQYTKRIKDIKEHYKIK